MKRDQNGVLRFESTDGLQVGNKIIHIASDREVTIHTIHGVVKDHLDVCSEHSSVETWIDVQEFAPIPLTIERAKSMLEAKGFECKTLTYSVVFKQDCKSTDYIEVYMNGFMSFDLINYDFKNEKFDLRFSGQIQGVPIQYIHELQNFIQLLTGDRI